MDFFSNIYLGFSVVLAPANLFFCLVGVLIGNLIGVLPGLGPVTTIPLLIPVTYGMPSETAIIMLAGIFYGASTEARPHPLWEALRNEGIHWEIIKKILKHSEPARYRLKEPISQRY
jgi:hypothetical protein